MYPWLDKCENIFFYVKFELKNDKTRLIQFAGLAVFHFKYKYHTDIVVLTVKKG